VHVSSHILVPCLTYAPCCCCSCVDSTFCCTAPLQSIISPHLYPPTITKSTWLGEELWKQSNTSFGYLQSTGYCLSNGYCTKFPVLVGETGSAYTEQDDKTWLKDFADFANARVSNCCRYIIASSHPLYRITANVQLGDAACQLQLSRHGQMRKAIRLVARPAAIVQAGVPRFAAFSELITCGTPHTFLELLYPAVCCRAAPGATTRSR
jgi:hypothetical protein